MTVQAAAFSGEIKAFGGLDGVWLLEAAALMAKVFLRVLSEKRMWVGRRMPVTAELWREYGGGMRGVENDALIERVGFIFWRVFEL